MNITKKTTALPPPVASGQAALPVQPVSAANTPASATPPVAATSANQPAPASVGPAFAQSRQPRSTTATPPVSAPAAPPTQPLAPPPPASQPSWWRKNKWNVLSVVGMIAIFIGLAWLTSHPLLLFKKQTVLPASSTNTPAAEVARLQRLVNEINRQRTTQIVVTQYVAAVQTAPSSVVMTATNLTGTIECRGFGGQTVGINGNSNIVVNGSINIYPNGMVLAQPGGVQGQPQLQPLPWPKGVTPTRIIRASACLLKSCCTSFSLPPETIRTGEDVGVEIPDGWVVRWHFNVNPDQFETALDGATYNVYQDNAAPKGPVNRAQHHEWRFKLHGGGLTEARLDLEFYRF